MVLDETAQAFAWARDHPSAERGFDANETAGEVVVYILRMIFCFGAVFSTRVECAVQS